MKITHLTNSVSILAGGLNTAVNGLVCAQKEQGADVSVIAYWDERTQQDRAIWDSLNPVVCKSRKIAGLHFGSEVTRALQSLQPDITHVHGLWLRISEHNQRWASQHKKPYLVAPHGALNPVALKISAWKKAIAYRWFERASLHGSACMHALSENEAHGFRQFGLRQPIAVVSNGVPIPGPEEGCSPPPWASLPQAAGKKVLMYIGRIHPQKGLPLLVEAMHLLHRRQPALLEGWIAVIAGYDQLGHIAELQSRIDSLQLQNYFHFAGAIHGEVKASALRHANATILPSYSEGSPMSILEAWSYGVPTIMTPQCNLPIGFSEGASLRAETDAQSVSEALETLFAMSQSQLQDMGTKARQLIESRYSWSKVARQMLDVYKWLCDKGEAPDCVQSHGI